MKNFIEETNMGARDLKITIAEIEHLFVDGAKCIMIGIGMAQSEQKENHNYPVSHLALVCIIRNCIDCSTSYSSM